MKLIYNTLLFFLILFLFVSCTNYGKKIKIDGTKGEIYYKEGVTESDAKKVGEFLKNDFFTQDKEASAQLVKDGDTYIVRFVYDKKYFDTAKGIETIFKMTAIEISKNIFNNKKVDIALANNSFEDFKRISYDKNLSFFNQEFSEKNLAENHLYYTKNISSSEANDLYNFFIKEEFFSQKNTVTIWLDKQAKTYNIKYLVKDEVLSDSTFLNNGSNFCNEIKHNVFPTANLQFELLNSNMQVGKTFNK